MAENLFGWLLVIGAPTTAPTPLMAGHPFWFVLTVVVVIWYSTITVLVAVLGARDIRSMLKKLAAEADLETPGFPVITPPHPPSSPPQEGGPNR